MVVTECHNSGAKKILGACHSGESETHTVFDTGESAQDDGDGKCVIDAKDEKKLQGKKRGKTNYCDESHITNKTTHISKKNFQIIFTLVMSHMLIVGSKDPSILPETDKKMDKLEEKGKESRQKVKEATLGAYLRQTADEVDAAEDKSHEELLEVMKTTVVGLATKSVNVMMDAQRAEECYRSGRHLSDEVIRKRSDTGRFGNIGKKNNENLQFTCEFCEFTHEDIDTILRHTKEYHTAKSATVCFCCYYKERMLN